MPANRDDHGDVEFFVRLDQIGAAAAVVFVSLANLVGIKDSGVWLIIPFLVLLNLGLALARALLNRGLLIQALGVVAAANWLVALAVPVLFPFLWPVMILTALMPLVLASPHLSRRQIIPAIIAAAMVAGVVAAIGLLNDDGGVIRDIDDSFELIIVVGSLVAQIVPIGLVTWQHNQMQRANLDRLQTLNTSLRSSEAALATSRNRVVQAADTERRRIERDLHDGAQQRLVALGVRLRLLQSQGHEDPAVVSGVQTLISELDGAIADVRELAHGIYPPLLQTRGLPDAITAVARRSPLIVTTTIEDIPRLDQSAETALYFTALEALTNAAKHAPSATVDLLLRRTPLSIELTVVDGGPGFDDATVEHSHGFNNMADRLAVVGGTLFVSSEVGTGTTIRASVPLQSIAD